MTEFRSKARKAASRCVRPLLRRAARSYIAGELLEDALEVRGYWRSRGYRTTLGFWDSATQSAEQVAEAYRLAIEALSRSEDYVSIKLPALRFSREICVELASVAAAAGVRLHCDALDNEFADQTHKLIEQMLKAGATMSITLPGRWQRSLEDACWATEHNLSVRVVKGEWLDPTDPARDVHTGFLELVDRLAGRTAPVALASHDVPLAAEAFGRLTTAGTPCSLELLYGLPMQASLQWAAKQNVAVGVYIPYGTAYLPYALGKLRRNPRIAWWLMKDLFRLKSTRA